MPNNQLTLDYKPHCAGDVTVPGSKSLSNRALLLAALCDGETKVENLLHSDDIQHMLKALQNLGIQTSLSADQTSCTVKGKGGDFLAPTEDLFLGNAGTAMRPLAAVLSVLGVPCKLTGEPRMYERPIKHLVDALNPITQNISYLADHGMPPIEIKSSKPRVFSNDELSIEIDGSVSSQYLTALLMALPLLNQSVRITVIGDLVSKPYINLTLDIMAKFGVQVAHEDMQSFYLTGREQYRSPGKYMVEGDASSASYFLAAGAISGGPVRVFGVGKESVQGDIQFADALVKMGADIEYHDDHIKVSRQKPLTAIDMDFNHIPDAAMTIGTTALFATGTTVIRNVYNWRVKETDRLSAMATELKKVGAIVVEGEDYLEVTPPKAIKHAQIDTYDDHRIAMCFSLLSLDKASVTINDPEVTSKTFPDYFDRFRQLTEV